MIAMRVLPFLAVVCATGLAWAQAETPKQRVELADPAADVEGYDGHPGKDVVKVVLDSDGEALLVEVKLAKEAPFYLQGHQAGEVVVPSFDTDGETATGGTIMFGKRPGFEVQVGVRSCIEYERGEACVGGLKGSPEKAYFSSFKVARFAQGESSAKNAHDVFWKSPRQPITGDKVQAVLPYTELGVKPGQAVRVAIREVDAGPMEDAYFTGVTLSLR
jgi:hypothetical protein